MHKETLINLLSLFKSSRDKLSYDFINENIDIYSPMFKYEGDNELMKLSIEKYFIGYINSHFREFDKADTKSKEFNNAMISFLKSFNINVNNINSTYGKDLFSTIIQQKLFFLEDIISLSNNDIDKYNKLMYSYEKDKTLFDREINKEK